jgi:hypothetical protein
MGATPGSSTSSLQARGNEKILSKFWRQILVEINSEWNPLEALVFALHFQNTFNEKFPFILL